MSKTNADYGIYDEILEVRICLDGDKWCAMIGKDLQEGLAGFGDTPLDALYELLNELESNPWNMKDFALS